MLVVLQLKPREGCPSRGSIEPSGFSSAPELVCPTAADITTNGASSVDDAADLVNEPTICSVWLT